MPRLFAAVFVLGFAAVSSGQDKKSDKFVSKEGKYSITFPGKPTVVSNKAGGIDLNIATFEKGTTGFTVIYSDFPPEVVKFAKPKELLDGGQKGLVDNFKAKVISAKDFTLGKPKHPARELIAEKGEHTLRIQLVLADHRLYQVVVVGSKEMITGSDADAFFKSFEITR
jgi:hypothetical protein